MNTHTELFDVVDQYNRVIGQETRHNVHKLRLLHRAVHIIVNNAAGHVYIQKRSMHKDLLPGCWTTSCSGHVDAGETYAIAAVRELQEELGIVIDSVAAMQLLFEHAACRETGNEFIEVYRLIWDGEVVPNPEEVSEGRWIDPVELDHWIARNRRDFAPSFRLVWRKAREMGNV